MPQFQQSKVFIARTRHVSDFANHIESAPGRYATRNNATGWHATSQYAIERQWNSDSQHFCRGA
jgi:hypothetical protein